MNNPLKYSDKTGEIFGIDDIFIAGFLIYTGISYLASVRDNGYKNWTPHVNAVGVGYSQNSGGYAGFSFDGGKHFSNMGWNNGLTAGSTSNGVTNMSKVFSSFNLEQSVVQAEQAARNTYNNFKSMASDYQNKISNWFENNLSTENFLGISSKNFEDIKVFRINSLGEAGLTLPGVMFVGSKSYDDINVLRHEYGHILQYRQWDTSMSLRMIWDSFQSGVTYKNDGREHMETWTEWSANKLAYDHFGKPSDWNPGYITFPTHIRSGSFPSFINAPSEFLFNYFK